MVKIAQPELTVSSLLIIFNLTSGKSSFRRCRNNGSRCSMVGSLLNNGASPLIWVASAARTCCEESCERSRTHGTIRARITSLSRSLENPLLSCQQCQTRNRKPTHLGSDRLQQFELPLHYPSTIERTVQLTPHAQALHQRPLQATPTFSDDKTSNLELGTSLK
jgi:hypothetical protein